MSLHMWSDRASVGVAGRAEFSTGLMYTTILDAKCRTAACLSHFCSGRSLDSLELWALRDQICFLVCLGVEYVVCSQLGSLAEASYHNSPVGLLL